MLALRELEDLSYEELSIVMALPLDAVLPTLARARDQLRRRLALCQVPRRIGTRALSCAVPRSLPSRPWRRPRAQLVRFCE